MAFETILVERRGKVALVTLNRPDSLNSLTAAMLTGIGDALEHGFAETTRRFIRALGPA